MRFKKPKEEVIKDLMDMNYVYFNNMPDFDRCAPSSIRPQIEAAMRDAITTHMSMIIYKLMDNIYTDEEFERDMFNKFGPN